jgi:hypothetical protein
MKQNDEILRRIARYLMLHGSFASDIGLLNGKMGILLFLYHYAKYSGHKIFEKFADEMISEIYREISDHTPLNFNDSLCGIGWGFEYLTKNSFVKADSDNILEDLDKKITEWDVRRITDISIEKGLCGIACYVAARLQNKKNTSPFLTVDYCNDLIISLNRNGENDKKALELKEILFRIVNKERIETFYNPVYQIVGKTKFDRATLFEKPQLRGIANNGYAGIGLKLILT